MQILCISSQSKPSTVTERPVNFAITPGKLYELIWRTDEGRMFKIRNDYGEEIKVPTYLFQYINRGNLAMLLANNGINFTLRDSNLTIHGDADRIDTDSSVSRLVIKGKTYFVPNDVKIHVDGSVSTINLG